MMTTPRLSVSDLQGKRSVTIDKPVFTIGRRATADLQVAGRDVSRDHARITSQDGHYVLADCGSRFGTFLNGEALSGEHTLGHGDKIRLGQTDAVELVFLSERRRRGDALPHVRHEPPGFAADDGHPQRPARGRFRARAR
mgnify:CR=1 FL=1